MKHGKQDTQFNSSNPLRTSSTSLHSLSALKHDQFQRDVYLPSASYFKTNIEKRMSDNEMNDEQNGHKKEKEKDTIPKLVRHFLGYTTAHGLGRLADNRSLFWKIFWSVICLGSFAIFGYQAHGLFGIYFSRPVTTTVRITFEKQVHFPAITICNLNMLRSDSVPRVVKKVIAKTYDTYNVSKDTSKSRRRRDVGGAYNSTSGNYNEPTTTNKPLVKTTTATLTPYYKSNPTTINNGYSTTTNKPLNIATSTEKETLIPYSQTTSPTRNNNYPTTSNLYPNAYTTPYNKPLNIATSTEKETLIPYSQSTSPTRNNNYPTTSNLYPDAYTTPYNKTLYNSYYTPYNRYTTTYKPYYSKGYDYDHRKKEHYSSYSTYRYVDTELLPPVEEVDEQTRFLENFATVVTQVPEHQLREAGHQFDDFVTNCSWRGWECKNSNYSNWWYQSWNYKYGNCYTFNGGIDKDNKPNRILSTSKPGPSQGLLLRLNIEQDKYLKTITSEAGVRVILHDQGVMPFPFLEGFSVSPGMSTSVGIQKTVISRVDRFNNNTCWNINELDESNIYRIFYNITKYTQQTCQNSCLGKTQFQYCGCTEYQYPSGYPACNAYNNTIRKCLLKVHRGFNNDVFPCLEECRQPCSESIIQKTISMSQWPAFEYESFEKSKDPNFSSKSALLLNIFFNELNYQRIEESFTYDVINLLADIGGQLGLWIGVSVITCFETLELFMLIAAHIVRKLQNGDRVEDAAIP